MIDVAKISYSLILLRPDGQKLDLGPVTRSLTWEENDGELAARLEAELQNIQMPDGKWLHQLIPLGGQIFLYADWGSGQQEIFRGTIFVWDYQTDPLGHFTITAYDQLIYLMKSKDDRFYKAGQMAKAIIEDIAKAWGIPLGDAQGPNIALGKQVFRSDTLADMISSVLDEAKKKGGGKWIVRSKQGKIDVIRPGQNSQVYRFAHDENVDSIQDRQDIEDLVTRVKIIGAEDSEGKAPVVAQLDGRTEFGTLQEVVYQRQYDTPAAAKSAAEDILKERGQPRRMHKVTAPDLPFLRKGDKVKVEAGTLIGYYIVSSVTHDATNRIMVMEVEDVG
jgi:transcription antitermination factor NusG